MQNEFGLDFNPVLHPQGKLDLFRFLPKKVEPEKPSNSWRNPGAYQAGNLDSQAPKRWEKEELTEFASCLLLGV